MSRGSTGTNTSSVVYIKKPKAVPCNCYKCKHSKKVGSTIYCKFYDVFSPRKTRCGRYWPVKADPREKKARKEMNNKRKAANAAKAGKPASPKVTNETPKKTGVDEQTING